MKTIKDIADKYGGKKLNDIPENLERIFKKETQQIEVAHYLNHLWTDLRKSFIEDIKELQNRLDNWEKIYEEKLIEEDTMIRDPPIISKSLILDNAIKHHNAWIKTKIIKQQIVGKIEYIKKKANLTEEDLNE